jgi:hypothetical protein
MRRVFVSIGVVALLVSRAAAQSTDPADKELIEKLLTRIDGLEKRVEELEKEKATASVAPAQPAPPSPTTIAAASPPAPAAPTPAEAVEEAHLSHDQAPTPESGFGTSPLLRIAGFGDFNFSASDLHGPNGGFQPLTMLSDHSGFSEGQLTLQLSSALSSKVSVFSEITFTARADAGTGTPEAPGFNVEVERLIIRYDWNDFFKVSFGRFHTPINYWNTAYHHGTWLQTTIDRPEMTQFGGSFIPVHFVGMMVEGAVPAGGLNLNYNVGLGNGRGQVLSRAGDLGDINNNRAWLVNLFVRPDILYGLQIGGSVYRDKLDPLTGLPAREWIQSAHVVWAKESPEFIAEYANVTHQPIDGGVTSNSQAFYAQAAYRLPGTLRLWKPYYRYEYIHVPFSDLLFTGLVPTFDASTAGVRYDITTFAAFKVEYRHYIRRDLTSINGAFLETDFTF